MRIRHHVVISDHRRHDTPNGRNDALHTGFSRPEKQGRFLCRNSGLHWYKSSGAHAPPLSNLGLHHHAHGAVCYWEYLTSQRYVMYSPEKNGRSLGAYIS